MLHRRARLTSGMISCINRRLVFASCSFCVHVGDVGPDERQEWLVGADSANVFKTETVHGEARIDRIVLPKVGGERGEVPTQHLHLSFRVLMQSSPILSRYTWHPGTIRQSNKTLAFRYPKEIWLLL